MHTLVVRVFALRMSWASKSPLNAFDIHNEGVPNGN